MHSIRLTTRSIDYVSDVGYHLRGWRTRANVQFVAAGGIRVPFWCIVDSGAPVSILPHSLWSGRNLHWNNVGNQLLDSAGQAVPDALSWMGLPCHLGETTVYLVDVAAGLRTGPHLLVARFVRQPFPTHQGKLEKFALLGQNFLVDNGINFSTETSAGSLTAQFVVP
jgi:hypothetical protein